MVRILSESSRGVARGMVWLEEGRPEWVRSRDLAVHPPWEPMKEKES